MNRTTAVGALAAVLIQAAAANAATPFFLDPVTTYANGITRATAEPIRDADTTRGCSRDHMGCCGGRYNRPVRNSFLSPRRCQARWPLMLDDRTPGLLQTFIHQAPPSGNGLEASGMISLGVAPNVLPSAAGTPANR